jgi:hypothetical protein
MRASGRTASLEKGMVLKRYLGNTVPSCCPRFGAIRDCIALSKGLRVSLDLRHTLGGRKVGHSGRDNI